MSDPLLRLISSGLRLWIASRCDQVGELDLTLRGSSLALLQGRLEEERQAEEKKMEAKRQFSALHGGTPVSSPRPVDAKVAAPPPIMAPAADILAIRPSMAPLFAVLSGGVPGCPGAKRRFGGMSAASSRGTPREPHTE